MTLPMPDEPAYTGDIIVKSQTYGKTKTTKASGVDKVRQAIASLEADAAKLLTIDKLDPDSPVPLDEQVRINKGICAGFRKEAMKLRTFIQNN